MLFDEEYVHLMKIQAHEHEDELEIGQLMMHEIELKMQEKMRKQCIY